MRTEQETIEREARRRAGAKSGWMVHATVYAAVNLLLAAIALSQGRGWFAFPLLGWGLGLAIHGAVVFIVKPSRLRQRLVERERAALLRERGLA
jgi:hypothetical protein